MQTTKFLGGKHKKRSHSKKRSYKKKRQHGGECGNSSTVAASYGGITPMTNYNQVPSAPAQSGGGEFLNSSPYNVVDGIPTTTIVKGGSNPSNYIQLEQNGGSNPSNYIQLEQNGGNAPISIPVVVKGGSNPSNYIQLEQNGGTNTNTPISKGGNLLNNIAVPAVLLYANNTFGKKKSSYTKHRRFRRNHRRSNNRR